MPKEYLGTNRHWMGSRCQKGAYEHSNRVADRRRKDPFEANPPPCAPAVHRAKEEQVETVDLKVPPPPF